MGWRIEYSREAARELKLLDKSAAARIIRYMSAVGALDDLRVRGKALTGNLSGLWRYRIGDYRAICDVHDETVTIYAVDIGHRRAIYRE